MGDRTVTEFDMRAEEFKRPDIKPEDYEFRADGKIVRKDRWERGMRDIASVLGFNSRAGFEISDVLAAVSRLKEEAAALAAEQRTGGRE